MASVRAKNVENFYMNELREFVKNHPDLPQEYINNCFVGKLKFSDAIEEIDIREEDFEEIKILGKGGFGKVIKLKHKTAHIIMACKFQEIKFQPDAINKEARDRYYMFLVRETIVLKESKSPYIPEFYGMHFLENDIAYYMEVMDLDAEMLYKKVYSQNKGYKIMFDGQALSIIAASVTNALAYLKEKLEVMHRDIKPPNILIDFKGNVKLSDLGLVVFLEGSIAKSLGCGSARYWAPEIFKKGVPNWFMELLGLDNVEGVKRILGTKHKYNVKSDVWSLGITLIEIARFKNPYAHIRSPIDLQGGILKNDAPRLNDGDGGYQDMLITFINQCLDKNETSRPHIRDLKETQLVKNFSNLIETQSSMRQFLSQYKLEEK